MSKFQFWLSNMTACVNMLPCKIGVFLRACRLCRKFAVAMGFCSTSLICAVEGNGVLMDCFPDAEH